MKTFAFVLATFLSLFITLAAANQTAMACASSVYGANDDGDHVHCNLTKSTREWCYYSCVCHNDRGGGDCNDIYDGLGMEDY